MASPPDALRAVRTALDGLAAAMVGGGADAVLASEGRVADAVRLLTDAAAVSRDGLTPGERAEIVASCLAVRAAVLRCRMLGGASGALERVVVPAPAYDAPGRATRPGRLATRESRM